MSNPNTTALLDQMVRDGYAKFINTIGSNLLHPQLAYTQGFIDGIRANLDELLEAYKRDQLADKNQHDTNG